jgi:magnesium transporter
VTLKQIKERTFKVEPAQFVYIIDEQNHLVGSTNFRHLILANPQEPIQKAAFPKTYFVHLDSSVKEVAYLMEKYKYYALPVVDENNILQGIITVDDVLSQVISLAWRRLKRIKILPKQ